MIWQRIREVNVMRILGGLIPERSFWCRLRLHDWTSWKTVRVDRFTNTKHRFMEVERSCRHCNIPELRRIVEKSITSD